VNRRIGKKSILPRNAFFQHGLVSRILLHGAAEYT